jgi:ABC-type Mn2+/Zn2+ transport system ATPase subunit
VKPQCRDQLLLLDEPFSGIDPIAAIRVLADADRAYWFLYAARRELQVSQEHMTSLSGSSAMPGTR